MQAPVEFELGGHEYRVAKLTVFQQAGITKRIAPLLPPLVPLFVKISRSGTADLAALATLLQPITDGLAELPDEATEYVIGTCLSVVRRKQGENFTPVWSTGAKLAMFEDLNDLSAIMPLVVRVIKDSLSPFLAAFLTNTEAPAPAA